jgi:hypothetical protein
MPNNTDKSIEQWLWDAACSIRGAKDAPKYKDYILLQPASRGMNHSKSVASIRQKCMDRTFRGRRSACCRRRT